MKEERILLVAGVPADTKVRNGYSWSRSPEEFGEYSLYQILNPETNNHIRFDWEKEEACKAIAAAGPAGWNRQFDYSWIR